MILGFMMAAYSVIGNDSIQTLGTFLHSNSHRPWWLLWLFSGSIMVAVTMYGWVNYDHDPSYARLNKVYGKSITIEMAQGSIETAIAASAEGPAASAVQRDLEKLSNHLTLTSEVFTAHPQDLDVTMAELDQLLIPVRARAADPGIPNSERVTVQNVVREVGAIVERVQVRRDVRNFINWKFLLPSIALLLLTRYGFPVSTSFLVLITFQPAVLGPMLIKSVSGYFLAFVVAIAVYLAVARVFETRWKREGEAGISLIWVVLQWASTAFLWSMWLVQDMANIFVYLPRQPGLGWVAFAMIWMLAVQALIYYTHGGKIQKVVTSKTNTHDVRSATVANSVYGLILYIFKIQSNLPMSTTWVFLGLLAGRELSFAFMHSGPSIKRALKLARKDMVKAGFGLGVSVIIAQIINALP